MKINVQDIEKIKTTIEKSEEGCNARLFNTDNLPDIVKSAEAQLTALQIPKKYWVGVIINCEPAKVPNSYKYSPDGTFAYFKRFPSGWFLTGVCRSQSGMHPHGRSQKEYIVLSSIAKNTIPSKYEI